MDNTHLDTARFQRIAELQDAGQFEEVIRGSQIALAETTDPNEQASLLIDAIVACQILDRLPEARQMLGKLKQLDISDMEGRLNAEFCEPCILVQEGRLEEGVVAFTALLERRGEILRHGKVGTVSSNTSLPKPQRTPRGLTESGKRWIG